MALDTSKLIAGDILNISLPMRKSIIDDCDSDLSKNSRDFRNLDANFLIDNGYIRFADDVVDCSNLDTFRISILTSLRTNLFLDPNCEIDLIPIEDYDLLSIKRQFKSETYEEVIPLLVGLALTNSSLPNVIPGQHHILDAILNDPNNEEKVRELENNISTLPVHEIILNHHEFILIVPSLLRNIDMSISNDIQWFKVVDKRCEKWSSFSVFSRFDAMIKKYGYRFVNILDNVTVPWIPDNELNRLCLEFTELQNRGWGQLMNVDEENLTFRVRSVASDSIMIMGEPSLYDAMYEVIYFHNMSNRITHSNYNNADRFEIRTSGFLARRRNDLYTAEIYDLCTNHTNNEENFVFDVIKISSYLRTRSFNDTIKHWYPREIKEEIAGICLTDCKKYSTLVFKFRTLNKKNLSRIAMIEDWINNLDIKGGFVISDSNANIKNVNIKNANIKNANIKNSRQNGYLIISGEAIHYGHTGKTGDLNTFLDRYDSFNWKKVQRYTERNSDILFDVDYAKLPDKFFVIDHDTLELDESYSIVREILSHFK